MQRTLSLRWLFAVQPVARLVIGLAILVPAWTLADEYGGDWGTSSVAVYTGYEQSGCGADAGCPSLAEECSCCPSCCCEECCCPSWTIIADVLILDRNKGRNQSLIFDNNVLNNPGQEILNVKDMDFDHAVGPRVGFIRCLNCCDSLEGYFFGLDGWTAQESRNGPMHVTFPGFIQAFGPGTGTFTNGSELFSTELNLRREVNDWLTLLAGLRWIELSDDLSFQFTPPGGPQATWYTIDTNNHLYGLQGGAILDLWSDGNRWRLNGWGKAGVYHNSADQSTNVFMPAVGATGDAGDDAAFVGDVALTLVRQLTDGLALRAGYQLLWVEGVALAPDQLGGVNDVTVPIAVLVQDSDVFYHGALVGLEASW